MSIPADRPFSIELCRRMEEVTPRFGAHVALTGGCLYKTGQRKDIDIVLYRIRQVENIDTLAMWPALEKEVGLKLIKDHGWCAKCELDGTSVDIFFPEVRRKTAVSDGEEYVQ